jgi:hypothetical protein
VDDGTGDQNSALARELRRAVELSAARYDFGWETNFPRTRGINHVVQVVLRPGDQMSFVSESIGPDDKGGVRLTPLAHLKASTAYY